MSVPVAHWCPAAQTSRQHVAFSCRIEPSTSKASTMPHPASAWNVQSPLLQMPSLVCFATSNASFSADQYFPRRFSSHSPPHGSSERVPGDATDGPLLSKPSCRTKMGTGRASASVCNSARLSVFPTTQRTILVKTTIPKQSPMSFLGPHTHHDT